MLETSCLRPRSRRHPNPTCSRRASSAWVDYVDAASTSPPWRRTPAGVADAPVFMVWCGDNRRIRRLCEWREHAFANDHLDAFMNAAVDAAIAMQTFIIAAESVGLGCCPGQPDPRRPHRKRSATSSALVSALATGGPRTAHDNTRCASAPTLVAISAARVSTFHDRVGRSACRWMARMKERPSVGRTPFEKERGE